jgi:dienelactone hydrolase
MIIAALFVPMLALSSPEKGEESFLGSLAPAIQSIQEERGFPLAFKNRGDLSLEEWVRTGRKKLQEYLSYSPEPLPLDIQVHKVLKRELYETRLISFAGTKHYRIPAYLLVPTSGSGPYPGIVALHDHSGRFYHGKEKLVSLENEHASLHSFRENYYGGRAYADELAKLGFVVLVPDAFYWGDRRLRYEHPPEAFSRLTRGLDPSQVEYVRSVNSYLRDQAPILNTWLSFAGTSWMGIVTHDDRLCVDVLHATREVDPENIGCIGLSGGGYRSTYLTGMEPRIKASVIVGWMSSLPSTIGMARPVHRSLFDAFGSHAYLDHPDIASLAAPDCRILVQNCARDALFTRSGMEEAAAKIKEVFEELGYGERFDVQFYDVPHQFNTEMQQDAFEWLQRWLGK